MKIKETYTERFSKNFEIGKEEGLCALNDKSLNKITMEKRGMCTIDKEVYEFIQVTAYFKKDK